MSLSVCDVSNGMSAAHVTKNANTAHFGTRSYACLRRPTNPS